MTEPEWIPTRTVHYNAWPLAAVIIAFFICIGAIGVASYLGGCG